MINLIPKEEKKKMLTVFYYRFGILFLYMLAFVMFVSLVLLLPSYFISAVKYDLAMSQLDTQQSEPLPLLDQKTLSIITDLKNKLSLIENSRAKTFSVSKKIISVIISKKIPGIKIFEISYQNDLTKKGVSIRGSAPSREVLLSFSRSLENDGSFKKVDLPVSNFVKGSNIQFYLTLVPNDSLEPVL